MNLSNVIYVNCYIILKSRASCSVSIEWGTLSKFLVNDVRMG